MNYQTDSTVADAPAFLAGGGAMGALIRAQDWGATPFGPVETWPPALRAALSICLQSSFPTAIYWGPELRLLYNDAWAPIPAERHPWALGRPGAEVWQDIWDVVGPQFKQVFTTGEGVSTYDQMLPMVRNGVVQETYWNYSLTAIRDERGAIVGVFNQGHETTAGVFAKRKAQAEIERMGQMVAQAPGAVAILSGPTHRFEIVNPAYEQLVGRGDLVGKTVAEALPEIVQQGFIDLLDRVFQSGEAFVGKAVPVTLNRGAEGREERLVDFVFQPFNDAAGHRDGVFVQATDVTNEARAVAALRQSEEFSRSVVESSADCIKVLDLDGALNFMNETGRCLMEIDNFDDFFGRNWIDGWPAESRDMVVAAVDEARAGGTGRFTAFCPTAKGTPKWWDVVVTPVMGPDDKPARLVSISRDVTEQRRAEEARQLLLQELDHRVKNLFSVAAGMVSMTARSASSVAAMADGLTGRLSALARAHELIGSAIGPEGEDQTDIELLTLLHQIVQPHIDAGSRTRQIDISGPAVELEPKTAMNLALVFHELATNAAKYGAFSRDTGHVDIRWDKTGGDLVLHWLETAPGQMIKAPTSQGFGSKLAQATVKRQFGGSIDYDWQDNGVKIRIALPLQQLGA